MFSNSNSLLSHRSRASRGRQHVHCDTCFSRRCRAQVEMSVCCAVVSCRLLCGAVFHQCKEEDHLLLCPNVRVPCLNAEYGCPLHLARSSRAAHLQECPASVVSCSMEWNRWPANDAHSHPNTDLHENLLSDREAGGCLDLDMALKDQDRLFHSLKMKKLFPELVLSISEEEKEEERQEREKKRLAAIQREAAARAAVEETKGQWESFNIFAMSQPEEEKEEEEEVPLDQELTQEEREAIARGDGVSEQLLENYNAWERMFSMEMGGCREAKGSAEAGGARVTKAKGLGVLMEEEAEGATCTQLNGECSSSHSSSSTCTMNLPKKKFEYGRLEPMKITAVRTFKVPTSFAAKHGRIRNPGFYKRESKAVDTSDLEVRDEDMPIWDEVQASLLCSLEKEQRGHLIAESVCTDGLLQDEGTQTYAFLTAPFRRNTSLAHLNASKPLELHLQLQVESVNSRHHKASSAFTFLCGHAFQRREYGRHYKNIHSDIQMCVNGWFHQRCPLAYLGCTFSQERFRPSTHEANVTYNGELGCFRLCPSTTVSLRRGGRDDVLSSLPFEVLCHVASFLDSLSLSQLALVSRLMRQVCSTQLQDRGMVTLQWERRPSSHGGAKWRVKQKVWHFSTLFSPVDSWSFRDLAPMSEHLKTCHYYERESTNEPVLLPQFSEKVQPSKLC
ncbi:F-box only protein 40-like [Synchiropus splendidus]|uniref:F-box only protein 40-like n=1 Tax=Synchiropus splendidus TaxID=270530 RepID=UPI00237E7445|nr:F-box only protein 40-like [Synchiropus splendidus]